MGIHLCSSSNDRLVYIKQLGIPIAPTLNEADEESINNCSALNTTIDQFSKYCDFIAIIGDVNRKQGKRMIRKEIIFCPYGYELEIKEATF